MPENGYTSPTSIQTVEEIAPVENGGYILIYSTIYAIQPNSEPDYGGSDCGVDSEYSEFG